MPQLWFFTATSRSFLHEAEKERDARASGFQPWFVLPSKFPLCVYLLVIYLDRSALSRFHLVLCTVCSFTPTLLSLPFACPYKAPLRLVPLVPLVPLCPPRFFSAFLLTIFTSVWSIVFISHTYNYEDACRITRRSAVALWTTRCKKTWDGRGVLFHTADKTQTADYILA